MTKADYVGIAIFVGIGLFIIISIIGTFAIDKSYAKSSITLETKYPILKDLRLLVKSRTELLYRQSELKVAIENEVKELIYYNCDSAEYAQIELVIDSYKNSYADCVHNLNSIQDEYEQKYQQAKAEVDEKTFEKYQKILDNNRWQ